MFHVVYMLCVHSFVFLFLNRFVLFMCAFYKLYISFSIVFACMPICDFILCLLLIYQTMKLLHSHASAFDFALFGFTFKLSVFQILYLIKCIKAFPLNLTDLLNYFQNIMYILLNIVAIPSNPPFGIKAFHFVLD